MIDNIYTVDGTPCITIKNFSDLTKRSESSIRHLIIKGNIIRKLRTVYVGDKPLIPVEELYEFPFVKNGRPNEFGFLVTKYRHTDNGLIQEESFIHNPKYVKEGVNE